MAQSDPRQAIIEYLSGTGGLEPEKRGASGGARADMRWRNARRGIGAKAESFRFLKERSIPGRSVHACTFETRMGEIMHMMIYLVQDDAGEWQFRGATGGGSRGPERSQPWVEISGGGWPRDFYAGGAVLDRGAGVVRVRLVAGNGLMLEDTVDDGLVLFLTDQAVALPLRAEFYTETGEMVGSHTVFR